MVAYQDFVSIVFDVAKDRGRSIDSLNESNEVLQIAAEAWSRNKSRLRDASQRQARQWVEDNL